MAELSDVAARADQFEQKNEQAKKVEEPAGQVAAVDPLEAAANMAEGFLRVVESGAQFLADKRLFLDGDEMDLGKASLAPAIEKYNLTQGGNGRLPYQEEVVAGLYLGGLWKRFRRALAALRAKDKAESEAKRDQANGSQRKYEPQEQSRPVPSEVGVREKPDPETPGWMSEPGGAGVVMGQQSGSSGAPV